MVRPIPTIAATALLALVAGPVSAAPLLFVFSGPSGTASFDLPAEPTPDFAQSFLGSDQFGFHDVSGTFGGVAGTAQTISFGTGLFASFDITAAGLGFTQFSAPTLFSGPPTAPVFATGSFTLVNPFFGNGTLSISDAAAAVPEPGAWTLMIGGFGLIGGAIRYRRSSATAAGA